MSQFQQMPMSHPERPILGKAPLILACSVALISLALASIASLTGFGVVRIPETPVTAYRDLVLVEKPDGRGQLIDAGDRSVVAELPPDNTGFIRAILKGLVQERRIVKGPPDAPYRLTRHADGRLILTDPISGKKRSVDSFGPQNTAHFSALMKKGGE